MAYKDPDAAAKQRDWHRRRTMNRQDAAKFKPQRLPDWHSDDLWTVLDVKLGALWAHVAEGADRDALRLASECWEVEQELKLRGTQLQLPFEV